MWEVYLNVFLYVKTIWLQTTVRTDIRFSNHGIILLQKMGVYMFVYEDSCFLFGCFLLYNVFGMISESDGKMCMFFAERITSERI